LVVVKEKELASYLHWSSKAGGYPFKGDIIQCFDCGQSTCKRCCTFWVHPNNHMLDGIRCKYCFQKCQKKFKDGLFFPCFH
jgi:hypothetical protein